MVAAQLEHREIYCAMWLASLICLLAEIYFLPERILLQNANIEDCHASSQRWRGEAVLTTEPFPEE